MSAFDLLVFPSGRSVGNCRKDAKRLVRSSGIALHDALNRVAAENGLALPWAKALLALSSNEVEVIPSPAYQMTPADIARVMEREPQLTHFGLGISRPLEKTPEERKKQFEAERTRLLGHADECSKALRWLAHATKRKTINPGRSSYGLKHSVEHYMKWLPDVSDYYVANGSFICAALHAGFEMVQSRPGSPNAHFNISERSPILEWARLCEVSSYYLSKVRAERRAALFRAVGAPPEKPARRGL